MAIDNTDTNRPNAKDPAPARFTNLLVTAPTLLVVRRTVLISLFQRGANRDRALRRANSLVLQYHFHFDSAQLCSAIKLHHRALR